MRMIGHLKGEADARTFGDYLLVQGIENQVESDKDGSWAVWIHAEEELERAKGLLASFQSNPADAKFRAAGRAGEIKEQKKKEQAEYERRLKSRRHLFRPMTGYGFGPVTFILICVSVVVFIKSNFSYSLSNVYSLYISEKDINFDDLGQFSAWGMFLKRVSLFHMLLPEIRQGEVWRLITPMFIHMSPLHILFNMLWLRDLGSMIEGRQNSWLLLGMVLAVAAVSDVAQFLVAGPGFGGMSGVVYGLFGYIWIRGKLDPGSGLFVHSSTVTMMIIWFFVCLFHLIGPIANTAHAAGLLMGMAWGGLSSLRHR
jgi:GlpG protein